MTNITNTFVFRCNLYIKHDGNTTNMKRITRVIVSKPPTSIHIEVDGVQKSEEEVINFSENESRKVRNIHNSGTMLMLTDAPGFLCL